MQGLALRQARRKHKIKLPRKQNTTIQYDYYSTTYIAKAIHEQRCLGEGFAMRPLFGIENMVLTIFRLKCQELISQEIFLQCLKSKLYHSHSLSGATYVLRLLMVLEMLTAKYK